MVTTAVEGAETGSGDRTVKITNSSGIPVCVLLAVSSAKNAADGSPRIGYLQDLTLLDLSTGGKILATGQTATVTLPASTDSPTGMQELLISDPTTLYPVHAVILTLKSGAYPDVEVTKAAVKSISMALNFSRNVMAAPSSNMAIGFNAALEEAYAESDQSKMVADIDAFFEGQPPFTTVTFLDWMAVSTWLQAFAYLWGMADDATAGRRYWLYPSPFFTTADHPSLGTIDFLAPAKFASPGDPSAHDSGFTITLTRTGGAAATLHYSEGVLADSAKTATLAGSFVAASWLTNDPKGPGLVPVLVGKVDGKQVVALSVAPPDSPSGGDPPRTVKDIVWDVITYIGLASSLLAFGVLVYDIWKWRQGNVANANNGPGTAEEQRAAQRAGAQAEAQVRARLDQIIQDIADLPSRIPDAADFQRIANGVRDQVVQSLTEVSTAQTRAALNQLRDQLTKLAEISDNAKIQQAMGDLVEAQTEDGHRSPEVDRRGARSRRRDDPGSRQGDGRIDQRSDQGGGARGGRERQGVDPHRRDRDRGRGDRQRGRGTALRGRTPDRRREMTEATEGITP